MTDQSVSATIVLRAGTDAVFGKLTDPATHAAIDGTGRVRGPVDTGRLTRPGQVFRMAMYHEDHPDGDYETANRVLVFERPTAVSWETGYDPGDGDLRFGGWVWRYDLASAGRSGSEVTLSYDWSEVPAAIREYLHFPPFGPQHLDRSLARLAALTAT